MDGGSSDGIYLLYPQPSEAMSLVGMVKGKFALYPSVNTNKKTTGSIICWDIHLQIYLHL